ncbi:MAG: hypothetical protein M3N25_01825 [Actinomycetota bacterium]|nr:hypothetical protein [Actinomycetota bacterium]
MARSSPSTRSRWCARYSLIATSPSGVATDVVRSQRGPVLGLSGSRRRRINKSATA